ncbi:NACHT domain-containing protein [Streptomyces sp. NPDC057702]|uniref:NACHT domain-containing protein n=1 Tax=unclassified Streptomyces TaxID=2593676 RepID=UPI0036776325
MAIEIIASALGILGKAVADPVKSAAMRRTAVVSTLKKLRLDPKQPPRDFDSLYAYALVERCYGRPEPVLRFFREQEVREAFERSFTDDDWGGLRAATEALCPPGVTFDAEVGPFVETFQGLVSRSRAAVETRVETKLDGVRAMLDQVLRTRDDEEAHRQAVEPGRAEATPAERLRADVREWFDAVQYTVHRTWEVPDAGVAMLVDVPLGLRGRSLRAVVLCVEGELGPHHLATLEGLVTDAAAREGWGVARLRVSEAARRRDEASEHLSCYSFDELVEQEVDFEPYIAWLEEEVRRRGIDRRYVPLSCRKEEIDPRTEQPLDTSVYGWREGGLDDYVESWLGDPAKKHLSLLGEFGMGKSWFTLHLAWEMAQGWRDAKRRGVPRPRVPLVIPLRDYAKQTSVSALLSEFFLHKHDFGLRYYEVFNVLNRMGRLLLIFDGFDEMASRIDRNTMVANFWELAKAVEPGAKVLLSSRTEHFPEAKQARDLFGARVSAAATGAPSDGPTFEIVELVPFDDDQIRLMLSHLMPQDKVEVVMGHDEVRDLMRRPVMSDLVMDALPEIERGATIDLARIYLYAIKHKMDRDVLAERTFTSRADKLFFLCEVAWEMLRTNKLTLNFRDFPDKLRACFGPVVAQAKDLDYWEQDMRNQGMLVRNREGDYGPSHKSLLEFLTAFKFAAELGLLAGDFLDLIPGAEQEGGADYTWSEYFAARGEDGTLPALAAFTAEPLERLAENFGSAEYNSVVYDFLRAMMRDMSGFEERLLDHIRATAGAVGLQSFGGSCANLLGSAGGTLAGASLERTDLTGFTYRSADSAMSLAGANLRGATLVGAALAMADKRGADFTGALFASHDLLRSSQSPLSLIAHPSGALSALAYTSGANRYTVLHWPTGDVSTVPSSYPVGTSPTPWWAGVSLFAWGEKSWGYCLMNSSHLIAQRTHEVVLSVDDYVLGEISWDDTPALLAVRYTDTQHGEWRLIDRSSGADLDVAPKATTSNVEGAYFTDGQAVFCWLIDETQTRILRYAAGDREWQPIARLPVGSARRSRNRRPTPLRGPRILADDLDLYLPDGRGRCLVYPRSATATAFPDTDSVTHLTFTADASVVAVAYERRVTAWSTGPGEWRQLWHSSHPCGITAMRATHDEQALVIASPSGEISTHSLRTGEILSRTTLNPDLAGARFSRRCGLDPDTLEAIEFAGGVLVD